MNRGRYYSTVMPIWAVLYVLGLIVLHSTVFAVAGAVVFALLGVIGTAVIRADSPDRRPGRQRNRTRNRNRLTK